MHKLARCLILCIVGGIALALSVLIVLHEPLVNYAITRLQNELVLTKGTISYEKWINPPDLSFHVYLYNVDNPDDVMDGATPKFTQFGPYVYDDHLKREVLFVDDETDEIHYNTFRTFKFNQKLSGKWKDTDQLTILNFAFIGTIVTVATTFPSFLGDIGDSLPKLFPNRNSIFVKGSVKDILFDGLVLNCNTKRFPDLQMICGILDKKRPPLIKTTDRPAIYKYSILSKVNDTVQGPFAVIRGTKNISRLGELTVLFGQREIKYWDSDECNKITGTDGRLPPPSDRSTNFYPFVFDICRPVPVKYKNDVIFDGLPAWKYHLSEEMWNEKDIKCYCPRDASNEIQCLPRGLLDITKCQEGPVIMSEPHFLHGDPSLLDYAQGLSPNESFHSSYFVVDPTTGVPLAAHSTLQLNMKLMRLPTELLSNVTDGYFPLVWFVQEGAINKVTAHGVYQFQRLLNLTSYLQWIPLIFASYVIIATTLLIWCADTPTFVDRTFEVAPALLATSHARVGNLVRRSRSRA